MCGIMGYVGPGSAKAALLDGLHQLEYRGYDSAGVAISDGERVHVVRATGKVDRLDAAAGDMPDGHAGIGHTRWATHGGVTEHNAHPHRASRVTLCHNGIIENYLELKEEFLSEGVTLSSETDSELAAILIDRLYAGDPAAAMLQAAGRLVGSFAFAVLFSDRPGEVYAMRRASPLVAMQTGEVRLVASDLSALVDYGDTYLVPDEGVVVCLSGAGVSFLSGAGAVPPPISRKIDWRPSAARRDGFAHFMLKEIYEQPDALMRAVAPRLVNGLADFAADGVPDAAFEGVSEVIAVACGTAMHAALAARDFFERVAGVPMRVEVASEFRYRDPLISPNALALVISQSGETADTIAALRLCKRLGARTLAVVNVRGSTVARETDWALLTQAGPEIAVASTKAFTTQMAVLYLIALRVARLRGVPEEELKALGADLHRAGTQIERMIDTEDEIRAAAAWVARSKNAFYIGRGPDAAMAQEGSLKLKEICYIHSEAYPAGELKHGAISLIEPGVPCVAIAANERTFVKLYSNVEEVLARGGDVLLIHGESAPPRDPRIRGTLRVPGASGPMAVFPLAACLQLLAYHCALNLGTPIDQPRNLAKSVTVE